MYCEKFIKTYLSGKEFNKEILKKSVTSQKKISEKMFEKYFKFY